eukprot:CAMPEP_0202915110 /NCGR_PEP_ID=MMETSP1392-20130828/64848_1 /ASSEMBLY_ACC=CAM_ASM_000868 /TAXON_ID=225041 /ORGANISM="Chlamydomonas chlamydogama, Strain SAG 11-48b" /LENGTH=45 /DNA_ID= /DNA_START= /DNA_END= /DNA_ORIENTATION=
MSTVHEEDISTSTPTHIAVGSPRASGAVGSMLVTVGSSRMSERTS